MFTRFGGHAFAVGFAHARRIAARAEAAPARCTPTKHLAAREPEHVLRIHAELPLDRITPVLAGWLRKLEPLGHGNPEPIFVARRVRLLAAPRIMKERHLRLELAQESGREVRRRLAERGSDSRGGMGTGRAGALSWACAGSLIDVAYRIRENDHPEFGGLEVEIMGMEIAAQD